MRRRIAATAATAAIAVSGGIGAASAPGSALRGAKSPTTVAGSERTNGADDLAVIGARERAQHRHRLARALADHLPAGTERVDAALASTERALADAYGAGPGHGRGLDPGAELARRVGVDEAEIGAAFEAMSRRALERRGG